jgi:hypothetical protein
LVVYRCAALVRAAPAEKAGMFAVLTVTGTFKTSQYAGAFIGDDIGHAVGGLVGVSCANLLMGKSLLLYHCSPAAVFPRRNHRILHYFARRSPGFGGGFG